MRTRTDTIVFRLGFTLAVLGLVVAQTLRRPCGALIGRLVASV